MSYHPLHEGWTLSGRDFAGVPATVPGCVHTDLLAAGLIDDPYHDDNETRLGWIGHTDWAYTTSFDWTPTQEQRVDLVCDGLDTVATVLLNGTEILRTANMHRGYRIEVTGLLRTGRNTLEVVFTSPYAYAEQMRAAVGDRPGAYAEPYQFIRKMACNFGWDWGPTLVTSGIWRPIGLHAWSSARIAQVRPLTTVDGADGRVDVHVTLDRTTPGPVTVSATIAGIAGIAASSEAEAEAEIETDGVLTLRVPDVKLWWPRGYGEQARYELTVHVGQETWTRQIGFRTIELDTDAFRFIVNGRPVFARGFNWIPDDCFPARVTKQRLEERFRQAIGTGANALRVWGGGLYESDEFYDLADRLGVLIWQDFPFACATYPEDEPMRGEVEAEARENVARLMTHPSLVLWCGNNENIEGFQHWGWQEQLGGRSWGAGYYYDLLPRVVSEVDPTRPYWPGSPYSGTPERDAREPGTGTVHIWTVWGSRDYTHYDAYTPRFVAEFGFQGPPTYATLRAAVSDDPLTPDSPGVAHHQKAVEGNTKLLSMLGEHLPAPSTFDDWHYYTQLNQARAMAYGVQRFRAQMPYCMGTMVWQLNDCWPVISWAAIDGQGRRKPLWYAMRRAYADRLLTFDGNEIAVVNDSDQPWTGQFTVTRLAISGEPLAKEGFPVLVPPREVLRLPLRDTPTNPGEVLVAALGTQRALRMSAEDPKMGYPVAEFDGTAIRTADGYTIHLTATTLLRELAIFPDRLDPAATIDDQLITLLPGESATLHVSTAKELDTAALLAYPVLRCVNERKDTVP